MAWLDDFLWHCREHRDFAQEQLERYQSGNMRLFQSDVDVSDQQIASLMHKVTQLDSLIKRAENERDTEWS